MSGYDLYRLRCSFLHQGDFDVDSDSPSNDTDPSKAIFSVLNRVHLYVSGIDVVPSRGMIENASGRETSYSVAVKDLCAWICNGVEEWLPYAKDAGWSGRLETMGKIVRLRDDGTRAPI